MNIRNVLEHELKKPSRVVKITDKENGLRLKKDSASMRYAYSLQDINEIFGSIDHFLSHLAEQGFQNTTFLFQRTYGAPNKITYHHPKEVTVNMNTNHSNTAQHASIAAPNPTPTPIHTPEFLGNPLQNNALPMQYLGAFVESERSSDYKRRISELEEDNKDYRSKIRRLEEENHSLKLKVDTSEERADLKVQKELLEKKGFLESDGFQRLSEGLGAILPQVVPALLNKGAAPAQLGSPVENLSPMKAHSIEMIKNISEEDAGFVAYVLQNMSDSLKEVLQNHIENLN
ncbi:hypothetical protein [Tenacibaculum caenipelagi]|uniref:Uncharacterized protein n=1 Tax=Tenacibaculum caenipelagi TaxID=1325435 RepID=A0A4R6TCS3_9FLAO|nr:hypothetical protein [Tenacibaculum caenipelagi]TDQ22751.1 hypothetical protein DFQ07_2769 [Tenacibaculum caenipelagi]